ncbi:hypothetical protein AQZ52_14005 [Novosphingobium fuchskuhlense]|uniref:Uncharacterized protein n=1 Tax=Novosphingobium fuchskuhlense TaxID=1117702 RepID=A0A124JU72_9SPHN|nr:hypothetical protein [Novosphingobium fuchskuhlense]KUR70924.1 hypothetical protein AQZ52_14005 [Novosphingobium fuchskuhlense]
MPERCLLALAPLALLAAVRPPESPEDAGSLTPLFVAGETALAAHDAVGLMQAAIALATSGAKPIEGEPDLARAWAHQAVLWGAPPAVIPAERGRMLGPGYRAITLNAGSDFHTRQVFTGGQSARVEVLALSGGGFTLSVSEDQSTPLCRRTADSGRVACTWVPLYSLPHDITVSNARARPGRFYLVTY